MASIQDRSSRQLSSWRVRWRDGRAAAESTYTFSSRPVRTGASEAEREARRLKAYVDLMGHQIDVVAALRGIGYIVEEATVVLPPEPEPEPVVTVAEYARRWLATLTKPNPRTRDDYRKLLERHVLPSLGGRDIASLTREDVALWLRCQEETPTRRGSDGQWRGPALHTLANRHGVLSSLLADAATDGLRTGNPAHGLGPAPKSLHREMCFLTPAEWALLHPCLRRPIAPDGVGDATFGQDIALVLVGSGLRWSELTALSVGQCELRSVPAVIRVDRAWKRQPDGSYRIEEPKSRRSLRSVDVPDQLRDVLAARSDGRSHDELVFRAPRGGQFLSSWFYDRYWKPGLDRANAAGLRKRPRVHDLRHTHASWLIADGRPLASIQRRLGHESITTTVDRYGHLMPELDARNADAIGRALGRDPAGGVLRIVPPPG